MSEPFPEPSPLALATPLGPRALPLVGLSGTEALSGLNRLELEAVAPRERSVPFEALLGQPLGVRIDLPEAPPRFFSGICSRVSQGASDDRLTSYGLELVPSLWLATRRQGLRLFQDLSVPEVLAQVLAAAGPTVALRASYDRRDVVVQYRETDFAFASRLMEEEGIFYFFTHSADGGALVLADTPEAHPDGPTARFDARGEANSVFEWEKTQELAPGKYALRDYDFEAPQTVDGEAAIQESVQVGAVEHRLRLPANDALELYDYPGAYGQRFDGVEDARRAAELRIGEEAAASLAVAGASTVPALTAGHRFRLVGHGDADGSYVVTSVRHSARVRDLRSGKLSYRNEFTCIPAALPFRPRRKTPQPSVGGVQTAVVVGPAGQPVSTDGLGRVKVQFHWDREGKSSAWIRVVQPHASSSGAQFLPEVGDEVLVAFEQGDPDRPYVLGRLYNGDDRPPETREDDG